MTYIPMNGGFMDWIAIMDGHRRRVLSWELSHRMEDRCCGSALERALRLYGNPEIFNTDQGFQFTGCAFTGVLKRKFSHLKIKNLDINRFSLIFRKKWTLFNSNSR